LGGKQKASEFKVSLSYKARLVSKKKDWGWYSTYLACAATKKQNKTKKLS
jgi:hypothetical protein